MAVSHHSVNDVLCILFTLYDVLSAIIVVNPSSSQTVNATTLQLYSQFTKCGSLALVVQDDPQGQDQYSFLQNSDGSYSGTFTWNTQPKMTDGAVVSPISWYGNLVPFSLQLTMSPSTPFTSWYLQNTGLSYPTSQSNSLLIKRVSCTCGNGILDPYEDCDPPGGPDGLCCIEFQWDCSIAFQTDTSGVRLKCNRTIPLELTSCLRSHAFLTALPIRFSRFNPWHADHKRLTVM